MTKSSEKLQQVINYGAINTDIAHSRIHEGVMYSGSIYEPALADGAFIELLVQVASDQSAHFKSEGRIGGDGVLRAFEDTVISDPGTPVNAWNRNRFVADTPQTQLSEAPTITDDGLNLTTRFIPGGSGFFGSSGGEGSFFNEAVLRTSTIYLIRLTNISGSAQPAEIEFDFYEPTDRLSVI